MKQDELKKIPGIDLLLRHEKIIPLIEKFGHELVTHCIRMAVNDQRRAILEEDGVFREDALFKTVLFQCKAIGQSSLKPVINATGIVLHTNLSRAPMGSHLLDEIAPILQGYSNLEFNLRTGSRGQRNDHVANLLQYITKAESGVVVNNNAAAVLLTLKTLAEGAEVIVSRGELIEIGGSFRIPDIMEASGATMVEVGTTNRTRIQDYERAITPHTKVLFKAHKSNYYIGGFTEETELDELVALARKHNLIVYYDLGSGLLRKPENLPLEDEPDVFSAIKAGVDVISFSGDKLLGGPQAGLIVGRKKLIDPIAKAPMMRALRVGKMTLAALSVCLRNYLRDEDLIQNMPLFAMLSRSSQTLQKLAEELKSALEAKDIQSSIVPSSAQVGGGTLPHLSIQSAAVEIQIPSFTSAKKVFSDLLLLEHPVLSILREGHLLCDVFSLFPAQFSAIASALATVLRHQREM